MTLSKRQSEILNFIKAFVQDNDYSPSYREIGEGLGLSSPATIHQHLQTLKSKGYLDIDPSSPRSLQMTSKVMKLGKSIELPLLGLITAGQPIEAIEENDTIAVPADLVTNDNAYVLRVKGESMIDEGIWDGDYVVVEHNPSPSNGDVVVALLNNAYVTLKKFYREKNRIRLQPANATMKPIYCKDVAIRGVVSGIIRKFKK
ncbi:repressor LexA [Candidatus Falkowbacteria bacterium RIFOXYD2_FULL_35_9]|uniref:LexA repressor n=1 Tax=Candidatus Falkowbacteria bacterium RIFOXYC2_FULL_36_12 TaxID=1798002 RepID=A0A1F5SYF4_9BACT|nr:MAG: repressor LexA [Candidatus Falkowbacteria bacterium RIFOXYC2_FULL_36_12]OGF31993.1 MAG: repressor LexA [Candidatus Falkowbacteria bacterium RIFOXYB2_FULL_35_7]OGF33809.1 MAG: repressor LexA [Candidatus Falkowbacteria bacterium RIFOXYA2_FULL_35_8]OGF45932.1 MAG: repressor LexA [Candidatus Falkowbacteria bacterium RIFOXYD2_FULL_35_9]